jgi:hypothetical protein
MSVIRTSGVLAAVVFLAGPLVAAATSAQAATSISPPTITALTNPANGPYPVGAPVGFTFREQGVGAAVAYEYTLYGRTRRVSAPSGVASVQVTPTRQTSYLFAYAVAADGSVSGAAVDIFFAFSPQPAADKDLNGDGVPDLLTVGGTLGLGSGLWLATGKVRPGSAAKAGELARPATDIGINGNGFNPGAGGPSDFDGAQAVTGLFFGDGFQDILLYYPSGNDAGGGEILAGSGDGSALVPISGNETTISAGILMDANGDNPVQVVNAYGSIYGTGLPDLLATSGDPVKGYYLDYYESSVPGLLFNTFEIHAPTPDGTADWNEWTLATFRYAGGTGMFLWNRGTGALYLWAGLAFADNGNGTGTVAYTQYKISASFSAGEPLSTLEAADFDGDGVPGLWAVTAAGVATAYRISCLSTTATARVTAGRPQKLY